ncbi:hypothetical protein NP233_g1773 [Leucocoprinus birnbaumii]|uniref:CBM21 domain-containing protein n=1 Tax=Leucocoprinus birnbaumii TaxID=56174 RepID=A0AAD5VZH0_9AGAR|nr:hypothetical protein NP233_g1773 [Leucocoprinus birnbaumii]
MATVRLFKRSAKPANLLRKPNGEDTETETEGELSTGSSGIIRGATAVSLAFPKSPLGHHHHHHPPQSIQYEIDEAESSTVPMKNPPPYANTYLESLTYSPKSTSGAPQSLSGTLLVRNLAYEKQVAVRFTMDDWQTTSEVSARHATSLHTLPTEFMSSSSLTYGDVAQALSDGGVPQWDRFRFMIRLEDYAANLSKRKMFLVIRYIAKPSTGPIESWDNNKGRNYKIVFKQVLQPTPSASTTTTPSVQLPQRGRVFAVSSPPSFGPVMTPTTAYTTPLPASMTEHAHLVAQTTLSRLKKLNLRNYAAPSTTTPSSATTTSPNVPAPSSAGPTEAPQGVKEGMEVFGGLPAHVGVPTTAVQTEKEKKDEEESSSDEESLKTPTNVRSRTPSPPTGKAQTQEYRFPTSPSSKARITADPIPVLTFSSSSSSSTSPSSSNASSVESTPTIGGLMPIDIRQHQPSRSDVLSPLEMGTSPPFSTLPEYAFGSRGERDVNPGLTKRREMIHGHHHHHPSVHAHQLQAHDRSFSYPAAGRPSRSPPTSPKTSRDDSATPSASTESYFPWALNGLGPLGETPKSPEEVKRMLAGIREKSTSSPVRKGSSLTSSPVESGRSSPVKRDVSPLKRSPSPLKGERKVVQGGDEGVVSPQPRRDWSKVGSSGWTSPIPLGASTSTSSTTSTASTSSSGSTDESSETTPTATANGHSDLIYQAVVKQWCFAQGPSPISLGPRQSEGSSGKGNGKSGGRGLVV